MRLRCFYREKLGAPLPCLGEFIMVNTGSFRLVVPRLKRRAMACKFHHDASNGFDSNQEPR